MGDEADPSGEKEPNRKWTLKRILSIIAKVGGALVVIATVGTLIIMWADHQLNKKQVEEEEERNRHDETLNRLNELDKRIDRARTRIQEKESKAVNTSADHAALDQAVVYREQAGTAWDAADYDRADSLIKSANLLLDEILTMTIDGSPSPGQLVILLAVAVSLALAHRAHVRR